jgi:AraC-like DNA-binding protein
MIPAAEIIKILEIHVDHPNWSQNRISRKLKISKFTVKTVFSNNFGHKRRTFTDEKKDYVLDNLHLPVKELAEFAGVTQGTIYRFLKERKADRKKLSNNIID